MSTYPRFALTPALPNLPIDTSITRRQGFEHEWLPLSFFWLARCFHISGNDETKEALRMRVKHLVRLYGFQQDLFDKLIEFGDDDGIDWSPRVPELLGARALQKQLNLDENEYRLLVMAFFCSNSRMMSAMLEFIDRTFCDESQTDIISQLIGIDRSLFDKLSDDDSTIVQMHLTGPSVFSIAISPCDRFRMHDAISHRMMTCRSIDDDMLGGVLVQSSPAKLTVDDYAYLGDELQLLKACIENASKEGNPMSVLFVGAPGSGKTELAKALSASVGAKLYDVPVVCPDNKKENNQSYRLGEYVRLANMLASSPTSHILFDEVEDVLNERKNENKRKGWINQTLEKRQTTTFWVCNTTMEFDVSFLRRFDYVLKMPVLDYRNRVKMMSSALAEHAVSNERIHAIASQRIGTPAEVERMKKLADRMKNSGLTAAQMLDLYFPYTPNWYSDELGNFELSACHASGQLLLENIANECEQGRNIRILVHGVSGTGKSALARYLCYERNQSIRYFHAIELISIEPSEFVTSIEHMFEHAERRKEMLVFDEIDQLLVATERMLTNPETFYRWFAERVRDFRQPLLMTLSNSQNLQNYHLLTDASDITLELKPWSAVQLQPFVDRFARANDLSPITLPAHCSATPQQLIQALRQCRLQCDMSLLPALLDHRHHNAIGFLATVA
ncbi:AAA family ATPase [Pseudidiomarina salilacus]|uniref:AAA family ATPase n=1 Tax=Pseudidiomarina salilacus TaxID=3384452 RepID=UPI0039852D0F